MKTVALSGLILYKIWFVLAELCLSFCGHVIDAFSKVFEGFLFEGVREGVRGKILEGPVILRVLGVLVRLTSNFDCIFKKRTQEIFLFLTNVLIYFGH